MSKSLQYSIDMLVKLLNNMRPLLLFYLSWIFLHYLCSNLYIYFCISNSIMGIFLSPFLSMAPHCTAFRWVIHESGNIFYTMWISIGAWIASNLLTFK